MELLGKKVLLDPSRLELLANYLLRGPAAERNYSEDDRTWHGGDGSQSMRDRAFVGAVGTKDEWERAVNTAYASARLSLVSMGEHSLCMARLITDPELGAHGLLGADVLCRSALEVGSRAFWLLDPSIGPRDRVVRYFIEELNSATEYDHVEALDRGLTKKSWRRAGPMFESEAARLGIDVQFSRRSWKHTVEGIERPSATSTVTRLVAKTPYRLDKAIVYSLLSGSTHGVTHSLLRSYAHVANTAEGERELERRVDQRLLEPSVGIVMMSYIAILRRVVELTGWPEYRVRSLYGMSQEVLAVGPR